MGAATDISLLGGKYRIRTDVSAFAELRLCLSANFPCDPLSHKLAVAEYLPEPHLGASVGGAQWTGDQSGRWFPSGSNRVLECFKLMCFQLHLRTM